MRRRTTLAGTLALGLVVLGPDANDRAGFTPPPAEAGPRIYEFDLRPTSRARAATGTGRLQLAWSPFGIAVDRDGFLVYDLRLATDRLVDPSRLGPYATYVAWIASPDLDRIEKLGDLAEGGRLTARVASWNKFLVLVTAEPGADVPRRTGPVVLQGRSPSGFMASFQSHELYNLIPH